MITIFCDIKNTAGMTGKIWYNEAMKEGLMEIFGRIQPGMALLVVVGILVVIVVGLLASGIVRIKIEVVDEDEDEIDLEEIKKLDDSTWKNRLIKWLAARYERECEKQAARDKASKDKDKGDGE